MRTGYRRHQTWTNEEIWAEIQELKNELDSRDALCGNCGVILRDGQRHVWGGMGMCVVEYT